MISPISFFSSSLLIKFHLEDNPRDFRTTFIQSHYAGYKGKLVEQDQKTMHLTETIVISLASCLLVVLLPVDAYHLESKPSHEKLNRHVRAIEAASTQPQQQAEQQQEQQSLYGRSGESDLGEEPLKVSSDQRLPILLSSLPMENKRYFLPSHDLLSGRLGGKWVSGSLYPRIGKADSNFIRFGRSFHGGFGGNSKKNNFIRLGRENPRQTNFIRLGRSGPSDSSDRFLPKLGFFSDYYPMGPHWSRSKDFALNQDIPSYDYN
ncbi:unnamed protein product [Allacma fusca]|uniref:Uncharacterized protein n=1 Tax=Allacma fusca TaxID=39272 RepID=A0A8J2P677_9HEXA|nr:unnamed protein product [Allacma fusca]